MNRPLNLQDAIRNLQTYLRALSFADDRITRVPIDGLFDRDTQAAVSDFQRSRGLPDTGVVDRATWDAIYAEYLALRERTAPPPRIDLFPTTPDGYEIAIGEESALVVLLQLALRELSVIYDLPETDTDGRFDGRTEAAVRRFQEISGLVPDGRVDRISWNRLLGELANRSSYS